MKSSQIFHDRDGNFTDDDAPITDLASATAALQRVVRQGEGTASDTSDGARAYIADYRRRTREIREMKVVQSYATKDAAGNVDLNLVRAMVVDLERERATPESMAQAVSDEKMANLYRLIANWNDPSKLG